MAAAQKNILYIDSDKEVVYGLKDYLEDNEVSNKYNLNFVFAESAKDALEKIKETKFDLIIVEILLPIINGYYLLGSFDKELKNTPVIVYTRVKGLKDLEKMGGYNVSNIFIKQFTPIEELVEAVVSFEGKKVDLKKVIEDLSGQIKASNEDETNTTLHIVQCPRCNTILAPNSHFCNNCGQKIFNKK